MDVNSIIPILMDIKGQLGALEGKLDGYNKTTEKIEVQLTDTAIKAESRYSDLDERVTKIEHSRARESGVIMAVSVGISTAFGLLVNWFMT